MTSNCCFACPTCLASPLEENVKGWFCTQCGAMYATWNSVPLFFPKDGISAEVDGNSFSLTDVQRIYDTAYEHDGLMGTDLDKTYDQVTKSTLLQFGQSLPGKRILDLGTGVGNLWNYVDDEVEGYAVDLSPVGAAKARERFPQLVVSAAVGEHLPFNDNFFDIVVAADTLEHTFDPERTIAEIRRVLRPGGILAASFPIPDSLRKWGWNQFVSRRASPRFLFQLGRVLLNRIRLFGKAAFQPIDRDLDDVGWLNMLEEAGFVIQQLIHWPEAPQAPIVYLVHAEYRDVN